MVEGVVRALGVRRLAVELGLDWTTAGNQVVAVGTDSSAAKAVACRRGSGRLGHVKVRWFWLQDQVAKGKVAVSRVSGKSNAADLMTKYLGVKGIVVRLDLMGVKLKWIGGEI